MRTLKDTEKLIKLMNRLLFSVAEIENYALKPILGYWISAQLPANDFKMASPSNWALHPVHFHDHLMGGTTGQSCTFVPNSRATLLPMYKEALKTMMKQNSRHATNFFDQVDYRIKYLIFKLSIFQSECLSMIRYAHEDRVFWNWQYILCLKGLRPKLDTIDAKYILDFRYTLWL